MRMMTSGHTISLLYQKNNFILKTLLLLKTISFLSQTSGFEIISNHYRTLSNKGWPLRGKAPEGCVTVSRSSIWHGLSLTCLLTSQGETHVSITSEFGKVPAPCNHYRMDQIPFAWNAFLSLQSCCCPRYHSCIRAASPDHPTQTNPPTPTPSPYYPAFFFLITMT